MAFARHRNMGVVCLFVLLGVSGCTGRMAGQVFGNILAGVVGAVAQAAVSGAFQGARRAGHDVPPQLSPCEAALVKWQEAHEGSGEAPPAELLCEPNGDWPHGARVAAGEPTGRGPASARTDVPTAVCGGTETDPEGCEGQRAAGEPQVRQDVIVRW